MSPVITTMLPAMVKPCCHPLWLLARHPCGAAVLFSLSLSLVLFLFFFLLFLNKAETNLECSLALKGQKKKNYDESKGRIMLKKYEHFQLFNTYCSESDLAFICLC